MLGFGKHHQGRPSTEGARPRCSEGDAAERVAVGVGLVPILELVPTLGKDKPCPYSPAETGSGVWPLGEPDGSPHKTCRRCGACGGENRCSICARRSLFLRPFHGRGKRGRPPQAAGVMGEGKRHFQPPCPDGPITLLLSATTSFATPTISSAGLLSRSSFVTGMPMASMSAIPCSSRGAFSSSSSQTSCPLLCGDLGWLVARP